MTMGSIIRLEFTQFSLYIQ